MRLPRIALLVLALSLAPFTGGWAQGDPLQDANQLFRQGQFDRAMDRVNGYLAQRPKDARGRFLKGLILTEQNKPNEAIKVFTDLSQDFPELPEPYNNLAVLYASQGQYDKARNSLEMAIRTHPSYATAHENLGDIYAKMASQAYDKALQLDRSNQAAQGKLNLIKDLFSQTSTAASKSPPTKVATAKVEPTPAPAAQPVPPPAAKAAPTPAPAAAPAPPAKVAAAPEPPAAKPAPAAQSAAVPARSNEDVIKSVNAWARAWASNDVPGYLSYYAPDFQPPKGMSRSAWEAERKARIAKPRKIEVQLDTPKVKFDDKNRAVVTFRQHYKSGPLEVTSNKTLVMIKNGDKWLIQQERS
ncbi:MAG TPA: tetratricopeptide repeat protein [Burkholderiales bacterium]|nr:tetratricopeptide repeat protein [Burkholderiales bacterium]